MGRHGEGHPGQATTAAFEVQPAKPNTGRVTAGQTLDTGRATAGQTTAASSTEIMAVTAATIEMNESRQASTNSSISTGG